VKSLQIDRIASAFQIEGTPIRWKEFGNGHINRTVKVYTDTGREYVLQRINKYVFRNPVQLMINAKAVTDFIRQRVTDPRMVLHFMNTHEGLAYHQDEDGEYWRMCDFIGGFSLDVPETEEDFYQSALAFGRFQQMLADFPAHTLYETVPNFHNTPDRYAQLKESVQQDLCGRVAEAKPEIDFLLERERQAGTLQRMLDRGELPLRVTHNDTKLNNVLLDKENRKALCVLDLDTVMPGLSLYDFGDSIRFGAATAAEDEPDVSLMALDLHLFEVYTKGYLEAADLTDTEVEMLPMGAYVITLELATRFLKDHLDGDLYFKTAYPGHNLVRARAQIKLAADMQLKLTEMNRIVAEVAAKMRKK
jgi:Ser/Thr protein kinase RdoA (MazF antagonist)